VEEFIMKIKLTISLLLISLILNLFGFVGLASDTVNLDSPSTATYKIRKPNINISIPQISNLKDKSIESKINLLLKEKSLSFINLSSKDTSYATDYKVTYNKDSILSILFFQRYNTIGAAHGYYMYDSITIDLISGHVYKLKDFYGTNENYKTDISKIINIEAGKKVESGEVSLINVDTIEAGEENFYVLDNYIVLYYNPYEIASYADGIIEFYIDKNLDNDNPAQEVPKEITKENLDKIFSLAKDDITMIYGNPDDTGFFEGSSYASFEKEYMTFFYELTDIENPKVISIAVAGEYSALGVNIGTSTDYVKKLLGNPTWEGETFEDTIYYLSYNISNYEVLFGLDNTKSKVEIIQIIEKN
jgi:hypothetical protein